MSQSLDKKTIEEIKKSLLERKESIIKELSEINKNDHQVKFPDLGDAPDENAQEIEEYSTSLATEKVLQTTLRDIEGALERIENKTYGKCKYCKKDIGIKRMLARPAASACVECKTKLQNAE
ncbi:hypothetical protein A2331_05345 [Candidatus Falkowbacteria bacterium RIFOXYB2_FULL_34_18]|uniref:Zinc finger DksA/TraR C4-type domain-containing protein n=1 Tax=Candidatus Falkowbacteria bacterium RIFOXYD2_FULL_34_120 TaxID=1798007 RepID=A0A1F5TQM6_9BACT|nr:MAG: hypothetical protein A2331_05345 [Candidatus Falkowbacteria bacterium RIFOXYB2_FULL_34_18]OGF29478.1 MAG: hypothetical protein A2500_04210 [Candidatus Falkowbacteria bacterium RIFOXYC12_FULL_34_55]OGF36295.1 MAG: hypothetical protein A2466_05220 [Candidatus Falkowbacteria bacterium RIFOXYC2_FULL_34_220]OGF39004.1 MAG: hypothetical protein A2515_06675 [Candidatus Falkowbacteria bacterium RIFOXYD12_FULL_34_57]OGF41223.1 MAG: hypothetical protein A2531_00915 [Candidatus Falkowbacteria bact